jgi:Gluconolactonase
MMGKSAYMLFVLLIVSLCGCSNNGTKSNTAKGKEGVLSSADIQSLPQKSELFMVLPDYCPTPDGMAIAPNGDLILACPNFADISKPACIMRITTEGEIKKWLDVPVLSETGWASPMGIAFNDDGDLFICDNQGWSGAEQAKNKGRILRLRFDENDNLIETIEVAIGMEHPNGIRVHGGKLYVTQSILSDIEDPSGLLVSGVYRFDMNDKDIRVSNTLEDKNLIATVITKNEEVQYGLDGIVFDKDGNLYVGNFGDGSIHKITMDASGKVTGNNLWAQDLTQLRTVDGICIDDDGNIWVADFSDNAVARVDKNGNVQRIAQSPDGDGSDGGLDQPGEPIVWNGMVIVSCFDLVTGPDKVNTSHDKPFTLVKLSLK